MYKENLERFLANQLMFMRNLRNSRACLERLANQAFGACSFVSDCLVAAGRDDDEGGGMVGQGLAGFPGSGIRGIRA